MPALSVIARTAYGTVRGRPDDRVPGVTAYLGVPYAAAPFGPDRFRAPRAPEVWDGVRDAVTFGATAPAPRSRPPFDVLMPIADIPGEHCLNLNIWTPGGEGLPVLVWLHGGGFQHGSNSYDLYGGANFARDGVVFVGVNYRLGFEGFALLPGAPANRGLRDQIAALEWVRENIAAFGGDPRNVTLVGNSAGGACVAALLSLDLGLFRRAVVQSGSAGWVQAPEDAMLVTGEAAGRLGVEPTAEGFATLDSARIAEVQGAIEGEVNAWPDPERWGPTTAAAAMSTQPVLDGDLLVRAPLHALAAGAGKDVPLLTGYTSEESRLFMVPTGAAEMLTHDMVTATARATGVPDEVLAAYRERYADLSPGELLTVLDSDRHFRIPAYDLAEAHAGTTWMYEFGWRSSVGDLGACHVLEVGFVFDNLHAHEILAGPDAPQGLADAMHRAWTGFATHGDPGWDRYDLPGWDRYDLPGWDRYDLGTRRVRLFDGAGDQVVHDPIARNRDLWRGSAEAGDHRPLMHRR
ncbi:carboxylesterase/lipase family protein [Nonomuraea typhae]|uniref:Carboxylic ester hydrolase n=1 Tax=Nonomuraea typhae TaxID=2603600 RepID=A0ABW7YQB4_9ACTN